MYHFEIHRGNYPIVGGISLVDTRLRYRASFDFVSPCFFQVVEAYWSSSPGIVGGSWQCLTNHVLHSESTRVLVYNTEINIWVIKRTVV